MMKLESQVCTVEQAMLLKSLGVAQKSIFYHHPAFERPVFGETWTTETGKQYKKTQVCNEERGAASAFTVAELSVMLPDYYPSWRFFVGEGSSERHWIATVINHKPNPEDNTILTAPEFDRYGKTQAEVLAILLIALLETEAIKVEEVNQRLQNS